MTIAGSALFLRYSLTGFLRFWMARQSHELALLADRLDRSAGLETGRDLARHDLTGTDSQHLMS